MLPGLAVSIISLSIILYIADIGKSIDEIKRADYRYVILAIGLTLLWLIVRAFAWRTLLREQASFNQVFYTVNEGYLLNNILPFRLGEIGRAFILSRKTVLGFWEVFSSILIERILDLGIAVGLLLISLPYAVGADWALQGALGFGLLVIIGFVLLYLLARNRHKAMALFNKLRSRWVILQKFGEERANAFFDGLEVLKETRRSLQAIGWILLDWAIAVIQYYILLLAFFPNAKPLWAAFTLGVAAIGIAAPSSPAGIGVFELLIIGALAAFSPDSAKAFSFATTAHIIQILVTGIFGGLGFIRDGESIVSIYRQSSQVPKNPTAND